MREASENWIRLLTRALLLMAMTALAVPKARADATACATLVSKMSVLAPLASRANLVVHASGGSVKTRISGSATPGYSTLFMRRNFSSSIPNSSGKYFEYFLMRLSPEAGTPSLPFDPTSLRGLSREVFPGRTTAAYDDTAFAIARSGQLQFASLTWARGRNVVDVTECVPLGNNVLSATYFPSATVAQRTLPTVLVTGRRTLPGYGTDAFQLLLVPTFEAWLD